MNIDINLFSKYFLVYLALIFSFILFGFNNIPISQFNIIIIIITVLFCCLIFFYVVKNRNEEDLHKIAFIVIITFGVLFVVLSPINSGYDEPEHFTRAEITSQGVLLPNYEWGGENPLFYKSSSLEPAIHVENNVSKGYKTISSITSAPRGLTIFDTNWDDEKINHSTVVSASQLSVHINIAAPIDGTKVQQDILAIVANEAPYDVFICYKEISCIKNAYASYFMFTICRCFEFNHEYRCTEFITKFIGNKLFSIFI